MVSFVTSRHHLHILIFLPHFFTVDFPQFLIYFSANLCKIWHEENLGPHHESEINLAIDHRIPFKATKFQLSSFLPYMNYSKTPAGDDFVPLARVKTSHRTSTLVPHGLLLSRQTESVRDRKFHSGYAHSSMVYRQGALYFAPVSNSRVNRGRVVHLSLRAFRKCVQK